MDAPVNPIVADYLSLVDDSRVAVLPHALRIAVELGVAEALDTTCATPITVAARKIDADVDALRRLLRVLGSVGFFEEDGDDGFRLTRLGSRLRPDDPLSLYASLLNAESPAAWLWAAGTFRTGQAAFDRGCGDFFGDKAVNHDANAAFIRRMRERTGRLYRQATEAVDWNPSRVVLDIGGADGFLLGEILRTAPHVTGILFDRPQVIDGLAGGEVIPGVSRGRYRLVAGDFFDEVPEAADTHLLCSVIHDWGDDQATEIFRNSRKALAPGGRLLVIEMLVPEGGEDHPSRWSDLGMMVLTGGRERTRAEFEELLMRAGYHLVHVTSIENSPFSVVEAV